VVEADEYDTAFFDKRSKFVHYRPRTVVLNNLEYDHADIFPNIEAIETQFHHLIRTIPGNGLIIAPKNDAHVQNVLAMGCWTPVERLSNANAQKNDEGWRTELQQADGSIFKVFVDGKDQGTVNWSLIGDHNVSNGLAAIAAARHAGVPTKYAIEALAKFKTPKRRMEVRGIINNITVYDDFAHHPTAIKSTLAGLRAKVGNARVIAILEPRSNTMRLGIHKNTLGPSLSSADSVMLYAPPDLSWDSSTVTTQLENKAQVFTDINTIVENVISTARSGDHILIMSNGGFGGLHDKLLQSLEQKTDS